MRLRIRLEREVVVPYSLAEVRRQQAAGRLPRTDLAAWEGSGHWVPLGSVPEVGAGVDAAGAADTARRRSRTVRRWLKALAAILLALLFLFELCSRGHGGRRAAWPAPRPSP